MSGSLKTDSSTCNTTKAIRLIILALCRPRISNPRPIASPDTFFFGLHCPCLCLFLAFAIAIFSFGFTLSKLYLRRYFIEAAFSSFSDDTHGVVGTAINPFPAKFTVPSSRKPILRRILQCCACDASAPKTPPKSTHLWFQAAEPRPAYCYWYCFLYSVRFKSNSDGAVAEHKQVCPEIL